MTNSERQHSLEHKTLKRCGILRDCGNEVYCKFCVKSVSYPCAKAYNKAIRANSNVCAK